MGYIQMYTWMQKFRNNIILPFIYFHEYYNWHNSFFLTKIIFIDSSLEISKKIAFHSFNCQSSKLTTTEQFNSRFGLLWHE